MADFKETSIDYLDCDKYATFCSSEQKWINKILKLKESHPDAVDIRELPENNHGMILAHVPKKWFKLAPPAKREMTDEQREAAAKRLADIRARKNT